MARELGKVVYWRFIKQFLPIIGDRNKVTIVPLSMFIYLITNTLNGKAYVGKTTQTVQERWKEHQQKARGTVPYHLYRAIRKYGSNAFSVQTLAEAESPEQLNELERLWILLLNTHSSQNGYNMTFGGEGVTATDEVREKIRLKAMGRVISPQTRLAISQTHLGKPKPLEQRKKMAARWTHDRKQEQAAIARRVNEVENKKRSDYICPDCGKVFEQVTKSVYGGHRKACLHWKEMAETIEKEMGQTLDEILESGL